MEIDKYVTILTFIPWIFIMIIFSINNLNDDNYKHFSLKYLKNNIFQIFRLDVLFLILAFYYFASFEKEFVDKYLFAAMCFYMFVNSFYEKKESLKKNFLKDNFLNLIMLVLIILVPFYTYFFKHSLALTYKIMFLYLFFQYILIVGLNYITRLIKKLLKK